jgi:hypothetical protein
MAERAMADRATSTLLRLQVAQRAMRAALLACDAPGCSRSPAQHFGADDPRGLECLCDVCRPLVRALWPDLGRITPTGPGHCPTCGASARGFDICPVCGVIHVAEASPTPDRRAEEGAESEADF